MGEGREREEGKGNTTQAARPAGSAREREKEYQPISSSAATIH
jgi:hypothetical protein